MPEIKIKLGPELDRAVAEAIGERYGMALPYYAPPRYSTDLNAAMKAAEKVGLFSETFWRTLGMDELGETWGVFEQEGCVKTSIAGDQHETPALAICAAILKLANNYD